MTNYAIQVGDRFYFNNPCVRKKLTLPDYLIVTEVAGTKGGTGFYFSAKYENRAIDRKERHFSDVILRDSNRNPNNQDPSWIFVDQPCDSGTKI